MMDGFVVLGLWLGVFVDCGCRRHGKTGQNFLSRSDPTQNKNGLTRDPNPNPNKLLLLLLFFGKKKSIFKTILV